jgi:hypothetical protein
MNCRASSLQIKRKHAIEQRGKAMSYVAAKPRQRLLTRQPVRRRVEPQRRVQSSTLDLLHKLVANPCSLRPANNSRYLARAFSTEQKRLLINIKLENNATTDPLHESSQHASLLVLSIWMEKRLLIKLENTSQKILCKSTTQRRLRSQNFFAPSPIKIATCVRVHVDRYDAVPFSET